MTEVTELYGGPPPRVFIDDVEVNGVTNVTITYAIDDDDPSYRIMATTIRSDIADQTWNQPTFARGGRIPARERPSARNELPQVRKTEFSNDVIWIKGR